MAESDARLPGPGRPGPAPLDDAALGGAIATVYTAVAPGDGAARACADAVLARVAAGERPIDLPTVARLAPPGFIRRRWWWGAAAAALLLVVVSGRTARVHLLGGGLDSLPATDEARTSSRPVSPPTGAPAPKRPGPVDGTVHFSIQLPDPARSVSVVGDFNGWDAAAAPMQRTPDGAHWAIRLPLMPGRHVYAFVVDGTRWIVDPLAPQVPDAGFGPANAVVVERPVPAQGSPSAGVRP